MPQQTIIAWLNVQASIKVQKCPTCTKSVNPLKMGFQNSSKSALQHQTSFDSQVNALLSPQNKFNQSLSKA
jgi:hypothetical protein